MAISVRRLLARSDLGLRLLTTFADAAPAAEAMSPVAATARAAVTSSTEVTSSAEHPLDRRITWVTGTDLDDPTPFLGEGNVVLTTGRQLGDDVGAADAYVARLARFGIRAIGFGSNVYSEVPQALIDACARERMPLFDVPYRTPFLAVIRYVADLVAAEAQARTAWAADAQRTIALAAMRDDGLAESVAELGRRLERAVTLFDARGHRLHAHPTAGHDETVTAEAERMLARDVRAAGATENGVLLQTIGRGGDLRGILAIDGPLDHAAQGVVAAVIALAGMSLERQRSLAEAALHLRTGAWQSLRAGDVALAVDLAGPGVLADTFIVGMLRDDARARAELLARRDLFVARDDDRLVVLDPDTSWATWLSDEHRIAVGLSTLATPSSAAVASREAAAALERAERAASVTSFDAVVDGGLRALLDRDDVRTMARALLAPLADHDAHSDTRLTPSLRAWLRHNGQWDPAARSLGIHRHTLRSHVESAGRVLAKNLADAETRAELLFALSLTESR